MRFKLLILAMLLVPAAVHAQQLPVKRNSVLYAAEFHPPVEYQQWYHEAERCAGLRGDYSKLVFAMAKEPWNFGEGWTYGQWTSFSDNSGRGLIIVTAVDWANPFYVKHEMLHDILWRNGFRNPESPITLSDSVDIRRRHPVPPFEKCAPTYIEQMRQLEFERHNPVRRVAR